MGEKKSFVNITVAFSIICGKCSGICWNMFVSTKLYNSTAKYNWCCTLTMSSLNHVLFIVWMIFLNFLKEMLVWMTLQFTDPRILQTMKIQNTDVWKDRPKNLSALKIFGFAGVWLKRSQWNIVRIKKLLLK